MAALCISLTLTGLVRGETVLTWKKAVDSTPAPSVASANVATHLFKRNLPASTNEQVIGHVIAGLADQSGFTARPAVSVLPDLPEETNWSQLKSAQWMVMDPLTISVVSLPPPAAAGLAMLAGLGLIRLTRWMRPSR